MSKPKEPALVINDEIREAAKQIVDVYLEVSGPLLSQAAPKNPVTIIEGKSYPISSYNVKSQVNDSRYLAALQTFKNVVHSFNPHIPDARGKAKPFDAMDRNQHKKELNKMLEDSGKEQGVSLPPCYFVAERYFD